jgi:peptidoglycan hydrolase CwlO-like protein
LSQENNNLGENLEEMDIKLKELDKKIAEVEKQILDSSEVIKCFYRRK